MGSGGQDNHDHDDKEQDIQQVRKMKTMFVGRL